MNDSELHINEPFLDDEEYLYHTTAPALPAYGDVLAALGNPGDPLAAITELKKQAHVGTLLDKMPLTYSLHFTRTATGNCELNVWSHDSDGGITGGISVSRTTRAGALDAALTAMEAGNAND